MAKKKAKIVAAEDEDMIEGEDGEVAVLAQPKVRIGTVEQSIAKEFGNVMFDASFVLERKRPIVSISPGIDLILGGGIPFGSFVIPTGPPKVGKTTFALHMAGSALSVPKVHDNERHLYIFNIEGRLKTRDLLGISRLVPHLSEKRVTIIESTPGHIMSGEEYLSIGEQLINDKPGCIFIFDSFSMLCSKTRKAATMGESFRDNMPLVMADFCKRISNVIPVNDSIVVGITHRYANTSGQGKSVWTEASGTKVQYQVDVKMNAKFAQPWMSGERQIGQNVNWEVGCSALGPPGGKFASKLRYGYGIDEGAELVELASQVAIIKKKSAWFEFPDGTNANGLDKASAYLRDNPDVYEDVNKQFREAMGFDASI